jgi:hypothetical protein
MWFDAARNSRVEDVLLAEGEEVLLSEGDFVEYLAHGPEGEDLGSAIARVTPCYGPVKAGRFVHLEHLGAENLYFLWYGATAYRGSSGSFGGKQIYHLCRAGSLYCRARWGADDVSHLSVWRALSLDKAAFKLARWRSMDSSVCLPQGLLPLDVGETDEEELVAEKPRVRFRTSEAARGSSSSKPVALVPSARLPAAMKSRLGVAEYVDEDEDDEMSGCSSHSAALDSERKSSLKTNKYGVTKLAWRLEETRGKASGREIEDEASGSVSKRNAEGVGLDLMLEFIETHLGEEQGDLLMAIALRHLLSFYNPNHPASSGGETTCSELRTLAEGMDDVLKGISLCSLYMLMQRFKAITVAFKNHSWMSARWRELFATDAERAAATIDEDERIRHVESGDLNPRVLVSILKGSG